MTLVFTAITSKNDVTLCKLDFNVKNRTAVAGSVDLFKLELKLLNGKKCYFIASSTLKIKCGKSKGMQEKYLSWVYCVDRKICHSGSVFVPISDPRDRFFYPHHTPMQDTYYHSLATAFLY